MEVVLAASGAATRRPRAALCRPLPVLVATANRAVFTRVNLANTVSATVHYNIRVYAAAAQ